MDEAKENPSPGANKERASKERTKNRVPSLPQSHDHRQLGDGGSPAFEMEFERDCEVARVPLARTHALRPPQPNQPGPCSTHVTASEETNLKEAEASTPSRTPVGDGDSTDSADAITIPKPNGFDLNKFKSKRADTIANVDTLLTGLPVSKISEAGDYVRLHPDEENYWSPELCFVTVPIKGSKRDNWHLIEEELAMRFLPSGKIKRFRLALATKPNDVFFLCRVPTRNLDNKWNHDYITACENAKKLWTEATSRSPEGVEGYKGTFARDRDAFPEPNWPKQSLSDMIKQAFAGRVIDREDHPACFV
jgi:hypothetical protein